MVSHAPEEPVVVRLLADGWVEAQCVLPGCKSAAQINVTMSPSTINVAVGEEYSHTVALPRMVDEDRLHCRFDKATSRLTMTVPELERVPLVIIDDNSETDSDDEGTATSAQVVLDK